MVECGSLAGGGGGSLAGGGGRLSGRRGGAALRAARAPERTDPQPVKHLTMSDGAPPWLGACGHRATACSALYGRARASRRPLLASTLTGG